MSISKAEAKQILERLIFDDTKPQDWVEDVWGITPMGNIGNQFTISWNRVLR